MRNWCKWNGFATWNWNLKIGFYWFKRWCNRRVIFVFVLNKNSKVNSTVGFPRSVRRRKRINMCVRAYISQRIESEWCSSFVVFSHSCSHFNTFIYVDAPLRCFWNGIWDAKCLQGDEKNNNNNSLLSIVRRSRFLFKHFITYVSTYIFLFVWQWESAAVNCFRSISLVQYIITQMQN